HYQWPIYWSMPGGIYHLGVPPVAMAEEMLANESAPETTASPQEESVDDPHLRSFWEVLGYHIQARDGEIGHVEDFVVDDEIWVMRYLVIDTKNWWPGKKVLIAPQWIENFDWQKAHVHINLNRETIKNSPEFDPAMPINRKYEIRLYDYYGQPKYWIQ
ncbi:MAG: PRC-barrel domain containing protein, partial [Anaerolineae bacterium]|nr:PRC-barrel domain containing protein [Anaerolineae bacterium]